MIKAVKNLLPRNRKHLHRATLYSIIELFFAGAPYGFLYMTLCEIFSIQWQWQKVITYLGLMLLTFSLQAFFSIRADVNAGVFAFEMGSGLRIKMAEHLRRLPLGFMLDRQKGAMGETFLFDVSSVEMLFMRLFTKMMASIILPLVIIILMMTIDWRLALALVATLPLAIPLLFMSRKFLDRRSKRQIDAKRKASSIMLEYVQGIKSIKACNLTEGKLLRLQNGLQDQMDKSIDLEKIMAPVVLGYAGLIDIGFIILLISGNYLLIGGVLNLPVFLLFIIISLRLFEPMHNISSYFSVLRYTGISVNNINEILNAPALKGSARPDLGDNPRICFENVSFSYGAEKVLDDVGFEVEPSGMTALVGPSGAGKSTLAHLAARFWDVDQGRITISGHDIRNISPDYLLSHISMVFQDVYLFNDTVHNNIAMGNPAAGRWEIMQAAQKAVCHDFIKDLPQGYDTIIGEGGATLSGGEKQRISIARAILKDAPIVLLDEATASLDPENEWQIQQAISVLVRSKTLLVIAHKLSTICRANKIIFLKKGRIIEEGNFDELMKNNGEFSRYWYMQQEAHGWNIAIEKISLLPVAKQFDCPESGAVNM